MLKSDVWKPGCETNMQLIGRRLLLLLCLPIAFAACKKPDKVETPQLQGSAALVNPFIGTGGHGHTYPGATVPFGMVQLSPDTRLEGWDGCSGYHDSDSIIYGFSHTHLSGTGIADYCDVLLMPMGATGYLESGAIHGADHGYASHFRKSTEAAQAGWYKVLLEENQIEVQLTATAHCGLHQFTYPDSTQRGNVVIDLRHRDPVLNSGLKVVGFNQVEGYRTSNSWAKDQRIYFVAEFSRPFSGHHLLSESDQDQTYANGKQVRGLLTFDLKSEKRLLVKVGISGVSIAGARANLKAELPVWDFEKTKQAAQKEWNNQLAKITVEGGTEDQQKIFYTALYHTMIVPNVFSDVDGQYRGIDGKTHGGIGQQYSVFSLWDTFRAGHPLYTLIEQKRTLDFIRSFLRMYQEGGRLPVWELAGNETECMIGYHSVSVIADAYMKGLRGFDADLALEAMVHSANMDHFGLAAYKAHGFIGAEEEGESVSKTLEYAYDDWCIAEMAHAMGKDSIAAVFYARGQYYKNLYDPGSGFFRAKMNGCWQEPFDPREVNFNFTEANAWQYSLFAPQDILGLSGMKVGLEKHLDSLFTAQTSTTGREQADITGLIGQYAHGNEPSHHIAWLYNYTASPKKTQLRVRQILEEMYHNAPDGLSGNEDCGQMSAWYVMSAMGLYAVTPGVPEYNVCAPIFPKVVLHLENGKTFEILAPGTDSGKRYIHSAKLNGKPLHSLAISHATVMAGGKLEFEMGDDRNFLWAGPNPVPAVERYRPANQTPVPFFISQGQTFTDTLRVELVDPYHSAQIHYTLDGSTPTSASRVYERPFLLRKTSMIRAISINLNGVESPATRAEFYKIDGLRTISLTSKYENQYAAGGDNALIDGLRGGANFRTGRWQGYQHDLECVVDLGRVMNVRKLRMGFLQDIGSWIWLPKSVEYSFSIDGVTYGAAGNIVHQVPDNDYAALVQELVAPLRGAVKARYIRLKAINYGVCPSWHLGAGGNAWVFADEIVVE
jgi:predicted alpha-1,2-mannosidase